VLAPALDIVRLSLHVLAAAVWVGGQLVLAGVVGPVRRAGHPAVVQVVARRFAQLAWPGYVVLLATGIWNLTAVHPSEQTSAWRVVLTVKIVVVVLAGVAAALHQLSHSPTGLAVWGALSGLSAVAAVVLGVALAG
jgi:putative copper export protein